MKIIPLPEIEYLKKKVEIIHTFSLLAEMSETVPTYKLGPNATCYKVLEDLPIKEEEDTEFIKVHIEEKKKEIEEHKVENSKDSDYAFQLWLKEQTLADWREEKVQREKLIEMSKNGPPYYNW